MGASSRDVRQVWALVGAQAMTGDDWITFILLALLVVAVVANVAMS